MLASFIPLLVLVLIQNVTARPSEQLIVPAYPTPVRPIPFSPPNKVTGGSGYASGCYVNSNIGGLVVGHKGNNNGPQVGNNVGVSL